MEPGDVVRVKKNGVIYEGILLPRTAETPEGVIFLKLKNGYNVGIRLEGTEVEVVRKARPPGKYEAPANVEWRKDLPTVGIAATGGTIASRVDYTTGGVVAEFTAEDFLLSFPEIAELANLRLLQITNIFSEDMTPEMWVRIAEGVFELLKEVDGVVITHGTDTMHYTSAYLSFALQGLDKPIVLTGAQRSSDRPSSDAAYNLLNAINVACYSGLAGVFVVMHEIMSDGYATIHPGTRVRKMHTSRRDTFKTIGAMPVGRSFVLAKGGKILERNVEVWDERWKRKGKKPELHAYANQNVALVKYYPGMKEKVLERLLLSHDGAIIEGTGMGHIANRLVPVVRDAVESGVFVGITSQTIGGRVHPHVYSTAVRLVQAGAVYLEDMLPETAYAKLVWVLGQTRDLEKAKKLMLRNIAGEITERSDPKAFLWR